MSTIELYFQNLPFQATDKHLESLLSHYGQGSVSKVAIIKRNNLSRGYGFAEIKDFENAEMLIKNLNNYNWDGRIIKVRYSKKSKKPINNNSPAIIERRFQLMEPRQNTLSRKREQIEFQNEDQDQDQDQNENETASNDSLKSTGLEQTTKKKKKNFDLKPIRRKSLVLGRRSYQDREFVPCYLNRERTHSRKREFSKTTIYISGLDYSIDHFFLKSKFPNAADIRIPSSGMGFSKGFAFVKFQTEEEQLKALELAVIEKEEIKLEIKRAYQVITFLFFLFLFRGGLIFIL
ncbi:nucleolin [Anaeramoeba flamelloides]|uniref:Nucleolin n=1 Tax=Anaeramoeba flamelloides TaxID=1746091 RepID=A0ABQ8YRE7_9EUKA|nr:nucleolin [Anaeramoeba flamelloides]